MRNVRPKYSKAEKFEKKFIKKVERSDTGTLKVKVQKVKDFSLKPKKANFSKTENRLKEQSEHQVIEVLPAIKKDRTTDIIATVTCLGLSALTQFMTLPIPEQFQRIVHYVTGALTALGFALTIDDIAKIRYILKWQFFFQHKDFINSKVEDSENMLNGVSMMGKEAILSGTDDEAVSILNVDDGITLHDLKVIVNNIEAQQDIGFVFDDPIERDVEHRLK